MLVRRALTPFAAMAAVMAMGSTAGAQNAAPFTIRYPPEGATVREKVPIRVPLASIPEGGFVAFAVNGQFRIAITPQPEQRAQAQPGAMFEYVWDTKEPIKFRGQTKASPPKDGEYTLSATLYVPGQSASQAETSSVKVTLANSISDDPGAIRLQYRYPDGAQRIYDRKGTAVLVAGLSQNVRGSGEREIGAEESELSLSIEDVYPNGNAIVRNKLRKLLVRQNEQETLIPADQLPRAMYQEVTPLGRVVYQNVTHSFDQFASLGVPVTAALELPQLPLQTVRKGDTWRMDNVKIDVPGMSPKDQPTVSVDCKLEGYEWEGGYPTAKIRQTYSGPLKSAILFGGILVDKPTIKFERDIYIAYRSGTLVRVVRTLEVTGRTGGGTTNAPAMGGPGVGAPMTLGSGGMTSPYGSGGMSGPPRPPMGGMIGPYSGGMTGPAALGSGGMTGPGAMGSSSMMGPYGRGAAGRRSGGGRGLIGAAGGDEGMGGMGSSGMMGPMMPGGMGGPGMMGGGAATSTPVQVTLRSTTETVLRPEATKTASK